MLSKMECRGHGEEVDTEARRTSGSRHGGEEEEERYGKDLFLAGVLTNPDSAQGRKSILVPTEVSVAATALSAERQEKGFTSIVQIKPEKLGAHVREQVAALRCDLLVSFAYGRIFGPKFLALFPMGGINIHPSLLPKYRGPSPITAAILARDSETGITIQNLGPGMDAGDILAQEHIALTGKETAASLGEVVSILAAQMLWDLLPALGRGTVNSRSQEGEAVYCSLIKKDQGRLDWGLGAAEIDAQVRAYNPWPLCFTYWNGEELYILEGSALGGMAYSTEPHSGVVSTIRGSPLDAAKKVPGTVVGTDEDGILIQTGVGVYAVSRLQRKAKKALGWKDFLNGSRNFIGSRLD
jgi:methionyl-tRNA formyltransferase